MNALRLGFLSQLEFCSLAPRVPWSVSQGSLVHFPGFCGPSSRVLIYSKTPCPLPYILASFLFSMAAVAS